MKWKLPPAIKVYEALGAVADGRVTVDGNAARVESSSGNKAYTVEYDPDAKAIMVNDNASYYHDYVGYPAIAFLMATGAFSYPKEVAGHFKGIAWKDLNHRFKNDYEKTLEVILEDKSIEEQRKFSETVEDILKQLETLDLDQLGPKTKPPEGY